MKKKQETNNLLITIKFLVVICLVLTMNTTTAAQNSISSNSITWNIHEKVILNSNVIKTEKFIINLERFDSENIEKVKFMTGYMSSNILTISLNNEKEIIFLFKEPLNSKEKMNIINAFLDKTSNYLKTKF